MSSRPKPPRSVQLPGRAGAGRIVELHPKRDIVTRKPNSEEALFAGTLELFGTDVDVMERGKRIDPASLQLSELHALRAIATHLGWIDEDEVEIECRNCDHVLHLRPCAMLPVGPFADAELDDPELDLLLEFDREYQVPTLEKPIRFRSITAEDALPLHRALTKAELVVTPEIVSAMGIASLGRQTDPAAIARELARCDDSAFGEITNWFLEVHYPLRLFAPATCTQCGSRNDVEAPSDREFPPYEAQPDERRADFPSFDAFDAMARRVAEPLIAEALGPPVTLVIEGGVPDCDDGGEPLLGAYVPAHDGDAQNPAICGEVTLYYRTFAAMWNEDGPYDVEDEIRETVEHELEHHVASLTGHDPKDDEERDEIAHETRRIVGKRALARSSAVALATDVREFWKRTWLVWFVALIAVAMAVLASR